MCLMRLDKDIYIVIILVYVSHCRPQSVLQNERAWNVVPTRAVSDGVFIHKTVLRRNILPVYSYFLS